MQYPLTSVFACTAFDRDGKRFPRCIFPHSIGSVPYLYRPSGVKVRIRSPYLSYFSPQQKAQSKGGWGGERMQFRNLNVAPPKPMPIADLLVDRASGQSILSFMDGHLGYNLLFISKEDEAKTAFRCPGAVGRTDYSAGR